MKQLEILNQVSECARVALAVYTWRDTIELCLLAGIIYFFLSWLNKDTSGYPLLFFHGYAGLVSIAYFTQLKIVSTFLLMSAPISIVLLIMMHQHTLQKSFITSKIIKPLQHDHFQWMDELMHACLAALNKQKEIVCVIERNDTLQTLLHAEYNLHADLKKGFLDMLIDHINTQAGHLLWFDQKGTLIGINAHLLISPSPWLVGDTKTLAAWKQEALVLTSKTDAVVMNVSISSRLFTGIIQGKIIEGLTAPQMHTLLKKYLTKPHNPQKDMFLYAQYRRNFTEQQLT